MLVLFADNVSRSLQARLSRRRRAYRAVMTFPLEGQTTKTKNKKLTNSNLEMAVGRRRVTLNLRAIEVTEIVSKVAGNKKSESNADRHANMNPVSILKAPIKKST